MERREFITLLGGAAAVWPLATRAQQAAKLPRLAMLSPGRSEPPDTTLNLLDPFEQGLHELGYTQGRNISIERQYAKWNSDRLSGPGCLRLNEGQTIGYEIASNRGRSPRSISR